MSLETTRFLRLALLALLWLGAMPARAHEVGLSSAIIQLRSNRLDAALTFAVREMEEVLPLDTDADGAISPEEFAAKQKTLASLLATNCAVRCDGKAAPQGGLLCQLDSSNNVELQFSCELPLFRELELSYPIIRQLTPGHRMIFTLVAPSGDVLADRLLSQNSPVVSIQMDAAPPGPSGPPAPVTAPAPTPFLGFLKLGVEHILIGYDHLLFLLALLIVTRDFLAALKVITCFTIAHSITLAVASFDLLQVPVRWVEPLIAATIIYVGVENLLSKGEPRGRWLLTFGFGLIHGFGFASVLRELGVGRQGGVALPLLSFNLGVEVGQMIVAAVALPVIWQLRKHEPFLQRGVPACAVLVALLGGFWFVQRVWL